MIYPFSLEYELDSGTNRTYCKFHCKSPNEWVKQPVSLVFNFIEEQHFQVSLSFQHYSYMIISSGHFRQ